MKLWYLCASALFLLSLIYFSKQYHLRNWIFPVWLISGIVVQLLCALGAHKNPTFRFYAETYAWLLTAAVLVLAFLGRKDQINLIVFSGVMANTLLCALAMMLAWWLTADHVVRVAARNLAFFGPALWMAWAFLDIRLDRLPLWLRDGEIVTAAKRAWGMARSFH